MSERVKRPVVVIGSGARALPEYLSEALKVCLKFNVIPVLMERPPDGQPAALETALGLLDKADAYVSILGDGPVSEIDELERDLARKHGIPRLMFDLSSSPSGVRLRLGAAGGFRRIHSPGEFQDIFENNLSAFFKRRVQPEEEEEDEPRKKGGGDGSAKSATGEGGKSKQTFRVFVASPSDVKEERALMPKVVESLNRTLGKLLGVRVDLWRWEADTPPAAGPPQPPIDLELDEADVVLVIFWNRFGTPAPDGTTGTEGEVLRALELWRRTRRPQVMVYFCQRPSLLGREALEQRLRLLEFRERIAPLALAVDYEEVREFEWRVRDDLFLTVAGLCVKAA